jgi:hypothetical protein
MTADHTNVARVIHSVCDPLHTMEIEPETLQDIALDLALVANDVANHCDHVEHCEPTDIEVVRDAAAILRSTSISAGRTAGRDTVELYAGRLGMIEARNVLCHPGSYDGASAVLAARTWRELQLVQVEHDRAYHPDVLGLPKAEQLRHFALHLAKLTGATVAVLRGSVSHEDWLTRRVPDMLLFGIKIATVSSRKLPDEPVPRANIRAAPSPAVESR